MGYNRAGCYCLSDAIILRNITCEKCIFAFFYDFRYSKAFVFPIPTPFLIFGSTFMMCCNIYKNGLHFFRQNQGKNGKFQQFLLFILLQRSAV